MLKLYPPQVGPQCRNVKRLDIQADMFLELLRGMDGIRRVECRGIPADAKTVGITVDDTFNTVGLYLESAEFPPVGEGHVIDHLYPEFLLHS